MKIAAVQNRQAFTYDPKNPGEFTLEKTRAIMAAEFDRRFGMIDQAAGEGADLIVTIEAFNALIVLSDPRYDPAEVYEPLDGPLIQRFARTAGDGLPIRS